MKTEVYAAGGQVNISEAKVGQIYDVDTVFVNDTGKVVYIGYEDEYDYAGIQETDFYQNFRPDSVICPIGIGEKKSLRDLECNDSQTLESNALFGKKAMPAPLPPAPNHVHEFIEGTITAPTCDHDGTGGIYCATCGYVKETYPISAYAYVLYDYGATKIKSSQPGQNVVFEFGEWNSFPKSFMADLAAKSAAGVTFEFHYNWNHEHQTIIIPAGVPIDLNEEWYGPAKMRELYLKYFPVQ